MIPAHNTLHITNSYPIQSSDLRHPSTRNGLTMRSSERLRPVIPAAIPQTFRSSRAASPPPSLSLGSLGDLPCVS